MQKNELKESGSRQELTRKKNDLKGNQDIDVRNRIQQ